MPFYTKNGITIFHSHIPKTGGSSIGDFLGRNGYERDFFSGYLKPCSLQHRHIFDEELKNKFNELDVTYSFAFIRDPLERFISEYFMRRMNRSVMTDKSFQEFVEDLIGQCKSNPYVMDNHIRPQHHFINEKVEIFRFGDFDGLIKRLGDFDEFDKSKLYHLNRSTESDNSSNYMNNLGWEPNEETIELIREFYKEDYKILNNEGVYSI